MANIKLKNKFGIETIYKDIKTIVIPDEGGNDVVFHEGLLEQPKLYTPALSLNETTLVISKNTKNGSFVKYYNIYIDSGEGYSLKTTTTTLKTDISKLNLSEGEYHIKVSAVGDNFIDSDESNEITVMWSKVNE